MQSTSRRTSICIICNKEMILLIKLLNEPPPWPSACDPSKSIVVTAYKARANKWALIMDQMYVVGAAFANASVQSSDPTSNLPSNEDIVEPEDEQFHPTFTGSLWQNALGLKSWIDPSGEPPIPVFCMNSWISCHGPRPVNQMQKRVPSGLNCN